MGLKGFQLKLGLNQGFRQIEAGPEIKAEVGLRLGLGLNLGGLGGVGAVERIGTWPVLTAACRAEQVYMTMVT